MSACLRLRHRAVLASRLLAQPFGSREIRLWPDLIKAGASDGLGITALLPPTDASPCGMLLFGRVNHYPGAHVQRLRFLSWDADLGSLRLGGTRT